MEPDAPEPEQETVLTGPEGRLSGASPDEGGEPRGDHPGVEKKPGKRIRAGKDPVFPEGMFGQLGH